MEPPIFMKGFQPRHLWVTTLVVASAIAVLLFILAVFLHPLSTAGLVGVGSAILAFMFIASCFWTSEASKLSSVVEGLLLIMVFSITSIFGWMTLLPVIW